MYAHRTRDIDTQIQVRRNRTNAIRRFQKLTDIFGDQKHTQHFVNRIENYIDIWKFLLDSDFSNLEYRRSELYA